MTKNRIISKAGTGSFSAGDLQTSTRACCVIVAVKLAVFLTAMGALPPGNHRPDFARNFAAGDTAGYVDLSQSGYKAGEPSCVLYPLWPVVISISIAITHVNPLTAALVLSNLLSVAALWLFFRYTERRFGSRIAIDSLILLLAFPGALFFCFPYSESLYLLVLVAFFLALESQRWIWVVVSAFLLPLARPTGIFIVVPLIWALWTSRAPFARWIVASAPILGYSAYFILMCAETGNPFEGFAAQKSFPNSPSIANIFNVSGIMHSFLNIGSVTGMWDACLDRILFVLFAILLWFTYRAEKSWFFYILPAGLIPALSTWFVSYRRYFIALFPLFIVLALLFRKVEKRWLFWYYVILMALLQGIAVTQFVNMHWAG